MIEATSRRTPSRSSRNWPSGSSETRSQGNEVAYGPIRRSWSRGVLPALQPDQDVGEEVAHLRRPRVGGRVGRRDAIAEVGRLVEPLARDDGPALGQIGQGRDPAEAPGTELVERVLRGPLGEVEDLRCEPYQAADRYFRAATWQP